MIGVGINIFRGSRCHPEQSEGSLFFVLLAKHRFFGKRRLRMTTIKRIFLGLPNVCKRSKGFQRASPISFHGKNQPEPLTKASNVQGILPSTGENVNKRGEIKKPARNRRAL